MPQPAGGSPIDPGRGGGSREDRERRARIAANVEEAKSLKELIEFIEKEQAAVDKASVRYKHLTDRLKELEDIYDHLIHASHDLLEEREKENISLAKATDLYRSLPRLISETATGIGKLFVSYHSYNLEVQKFIDLSGRFTGASERGRRQFEQMRKELSLTREEAVRFAKSWSDSLRLGVSTDQITRATRQLRDRLGHTGGTAALDTIAGAPISRSNLQGVLTGDPTAISRAIRSVNLDQAHAISLLARGPRGELAEEGARFSKTEATLSKLGDDIETAIMAGAAAGFGPEFGAMIVPLTQISQNTARLLQWALGSQGWLGPMFAGLTARLSAGNVSGLGAGALGFLKSGAGKLGVGGALAFGGGWLADQLADRLEQGSTGQRVARGVGRGARVVGYGLTGAAIGTAVAPGVGTAIGAGLGTAIGSIIEFRDEIVGGLGGLAKWITSWSQNRPQAETLTVGALQGKYATVAAGVTEQLERTAKTLGALPDVVAAQLEQSRLPAALESIDPTRLFKTGEMAAAAFRETLDTGAYEWAETIADVQEAMDDVRKGLARATTDDDRNALNELLRGYTNQLSAIAQDMDNALNKTSIRGTATAGMQSIEARRGQIGLETEVVRARYQRTAAITGDIGGSDQLLGQINQAYDENIKLTAERGKRITTWLEGEQAWYAGLLSIEGLSETEQQVFQHQYDLTTNQLNQTKRRLAVDVEVANVEKMNQEVEAKRERTLSAERDILFRRAKQNQALFQAQESFIRERGARPGELGQVTGQQAAAAGQQLNVFMNTFAERMQEAQRDFREAPDDVHRIQAEERIFSLANMRLELEQRGFNLRMHAATAEEKYRQEQIAAQQRIVEINRDMSARMGMSWRVQMGYQAQIIRLQQQDLQSTRRELEGMARTLGDNAMNDPAFINKMADLAQKQANLAEAIIGKQRGFLEQATAQSFGVGSGTRVSPILNPRMFGELIQGFTGMRQPGTPLNMAENRAMLRAGMGPQIFGGIPRGLMAPGGAPGAGMVPAGPAGAGPVPGAAGGIPGAPGGPAPGGPRAQQSWDVSGQILVKVTSDNPNVKAEVVRTALLMSSPGSIV